MTERAARLAVILDVSESDLSALETAVAHVADEYDHEENRVWEGVQALVMLGYDESAIDTVLWELAAFSAETGTDVGAVAEQIGTVARLFDVDLSDAQWGVEWVVDCSLADVDDVCNVLVRVGPNVAADVSALDELHHHLCVIRTAADSGSSMRAVARHLRRRGGDDE